MLTFLRKIRKSLIESSSARKYMLYAIGEILLVMIGILLAMQVNNWNEFRKSKNRLKSHYHELLEELTFDLEMINEHLINLERIDQEGMYVRAFLQNSSEHVDTFRLIEAFLSAGYYAGFDASRVAYDNLVNSGEINLIENDELKRLLSVFHNPGGWNKRVDLGFVSQAIEEYHHYRYHFIEALLDRTHHHNLLLSKIYPEHFKQLEFHLEDFFIDWERLKSDSDYSIKLDKLHTARIDQKNLYFGMRKDILKMIQIVEEEINRIG